MRKLSRRAEWIWRPRGLSAIEFGDGFSRTADEANRYVYFRHTFDLAGSVDMATIFVSADGRYRLFVNGMHVGRGPARCDSLQQIVDPYDLRPFLRAGRNVIAVLAHSYGRNTAWYELPDWEHGRAFGCGGLFVQGDIVEPVGVRHVVDTASSWKCLVSDAWQRDAPSSSQGFMEFYDAAKAPIDWASVDFNDSGWQNAEPLRIPARNFSADIVPFNLMVPRPIPQLRDGALLTPRLLGVHQVANAPAPDLAERLAAENYETLSVCGFDAKSGTVRTADGHGVCFVYDFGEVIAGYIGFEVDGPAGATIDFTFGEQRGEDGRVLPFGGIAGFDPVPAHRYVLREGFQAWERFEWNGLRYLQLTIRDCSRPLQLCKVHVRETEYPVEEKGSFECSDSVLNEIWKAGARTLRRCMHDAYVDCPSREQRQWMDAYVSARFNYMAFGDTSLAAQTLRQIARSQRGDGLTMMSAPGDFAVSRSVNIPEYCLYWIMMIDDYRMHSGELDIVHELFPAVAKALQWFESHLNEEYLLTDLPHWTFVDWAELDKRDQVAALNAQFVEALHVAARFAHLVGDRKRQIHFADLSGYVSRAINDLFWDDVRGVYADARHCGNPGRRVSQQTNAAVMAYGIAPVERYSRILDAILDERRLVLTRWSSGAREVPFDNEHDIVLAQPFFMHFLHAALRQAGRPEEVIRNIRTRWAHLLAQGDNTLRETWQLESVTSKCHAWSATPVYDLPVDVLGLAPVEAGFRRLRIAPTIESLQWARGRVPTPQGTVCIDWSIKDGVFVLDADIPAGCIAEIRCPLGKQWGRVNGKSASCASTIVGEGRHRCVLENAKTRV